MKLPYSVSLIIPTFNNESTALYQLKLCKKMLDSQVKIYEIVICNDGSKDKTQQIIKNFAKNNRRVKILTHKKNQGIAKTIFRLYSKAKYDYIMLFSIDGDWDINDNKKMLRALYKQHANIVVGKRNKSFYSPYRKIISYFYNFLPLLFFGIDVIDAGSNKIVEKQIFKNTKLISRTVFFEAELLIRSSKGGKKIISVPIKHHRKTGNGSGAKFSNIAGSVKDLIKLRISMLKEGII